MNKKLECILVVMFGILLVGASFFYSTGNTITGFVVNPSGCGMNVYTEPSITAKGIDDVLFKYNSPAAGTGNIFYNKGKQYGIDPVYALVFFQKESSFGKAGHVKTQNTKNIGNIVCSSYCNHRCAGRFCKFDTWEEGIEAWFKLIKYDRNYQGMTLVEEIIERYCPRIECDTDGYIKFVETYVNKYSDKTVVACGGDEVPESSTETEIPEDSSGTYEFTPTFKTDSGYDLYHYETIITQAKKFVNDMESCIISKDTDDTYTEDETEYDPDTYSFETITITYKKQETDLAKCLEVHKPENWEIDCEIIDEDRDDNIFLFCVPLPYKIKIFNGDTNKIEEVTPKVKFAMQFEKKELEIITTECSGTKGGYTYDCVPRNMCDGIIDTTMEGCEENLFCCKQEARIETETLNCGDIEGYECLSSCASGRVYSGALCPSPPMFPLICCLSSEES